MWSQFKAATRKTIQLEDNVQRQKQLMSGEGCEVALGFLDAMLRAGEQPSGQLASWDPSKRISAGAPPWKELLHFIPEESH